MKLFISHSEKDYEIVEKFTNLLLSMGMNADDIFCSSMPGFGIPSGENIYDYLKHMFIDESLYVVYMLSTNYYDSPACLNEMGAAWVTQKKYISFLLPGFGFENIKGAIDPRNISIRLGRKSDMIKGQMNDFKNTLAILFEKRFNDTHWEIVRDSFLDSVKTNVNISMNNAQIYSFCDKDTSIACAIKRKKHNELCAEIDFSKLDTDLCSVVVFPRNTCWTQWVKENSSLTFQTTEYNTTKNVTLEIKFDNYNMQFHIDLNSESKNYSISLSDICDDIKYWEKVKEICFLINENNNDSNTVFAIKNLSII